MFLSQKLQIERLYSGLARDIHHPPGNHYLFIGLYSHSVEIKGTEPHAISGRQILASSMLPPACCCRAGTTCCFSAPWRGAALLRAADPGVSRCGGNQEIHKSSLKQDINRQKGREEEYQERREKEKWSIMCFLEQQLNDMLSETK